MHPSGTHAKVGGVIWLDDVWSLVSCGFNPKRLVQFEKFKKVAEFTDTVNNTHVKIETPGYYRVEFMVKCRDQYSICLLEIGSTNEHVIHTCSSHTTEMNIDANDEYIEINAKSLHFVSMG